MFLRLLAWLFDWSLIEIKDSSDNIYLTRKLKNSEGEEFCYLFYFSRIGFVRLHSCNMTCSNMELLGYATYKIIRESKSGK